MIQYFVTDVDGTLTDGKIYIGENGEVFKAFNTKDGCGIHDLLIPSGIVPVVITGRKSIIVQNRCSELGIVHLYQGVSCKLDIVKELANGDDYSNIAYIGDDLNDMECMDVIKKHGGIVGCPADAVMEIKNLSDFVSEFSGGNGAVRDFIEWIVKKNNL